MLLTQINTDDLALHLLLATLCGVPSAESSAGDSGSRGGASESSAGELLRQESVELLRRVTNFSLGKPYRAGNARRKHCEILSKTRNRKGYHTQRLNRRVMKGERGRRVGDGD